MKYLILILAAAAQLAAVAWMIGEREWILANGREVKFVTRPADPTDPFRGRYVALDFEARNYESDIPLKLPMNRPVYAVLAVDGEGYAQVSSLSVVAPEGDVIYVKVDRFWQPYIPPVKPKEGAGTAEEKPAYRYTLELPFGRYYMNEKAAPEAERRYREANRAQTGGEAGMTRDNYLTVRILKGEAVAEQLYIEGRPIEQALRDAK